MPHISGVSVVMPAYNAAGTIVDSIRSCLDAAQAVEPTEAEIVVVDDGSTDATSTVVTSAFADEPRVRLHRHRRNRGGAAARNTAVERARHDWLFCLDADNLLDPDSFRRVLAAASTGEHDVVAPAEIRFFGDDPARPMHSWFWDRASVEVEDPLGAYETPVASGNYLFTLDAWARAGGYPEFAGSLDAWGFGVRLLFAGCRFGVCPDTFYLHRQGHESYYMRDTDDRRAIAAAQIILPYVSRLSASDRRRLLGDGGLLEFFAQIPVRPFALERGTDRPAGGRVVVWSGEASPGMPPSRRALHRLRRALARSPE